MRALLHNLRMYVCVRVYIGARATIVSQAWIFFHPREHQKHLIIHLIQIISHDARKIRKTKIKLEKISRQNIIKNVRKRKRKNRKRAITIIVETFARGTFLLRPSPSPYTSLPLEYESQTRPPRGSSPVSISSKNPPSSIHPPRRIRTRTVEKASAECPASRSPVVFAFIFRERSVFARLAAARPRLRRCACVCISRERCVGAESRPRERIQM